MAGSCDGPGVTPWRNRRPEEEGCVNPNWSIPTAAAQSLPRAGPCLVPVPVVSELQRAEPSDETREEAEEVDRSPPQDSLEGGRQRTACTAEDGVAWNGSSDQIPMVLLGDELTLWNFTELGAPDSPMPSYKHSCSCQAESSDPFRTYLEEENSSCSVTCQRWASESPGAAEVAFNSDSAALSQGQEEDKEDDGASGASNDLYNSGKTLGGRKNGRRQRHHSGPKDEEGKENARREGRSMPAGGKHKQARKRSHTDRQRHLKMDVPKQLEELAQICVSCFKKLIKLVLAITHECGECVEAGGRLLYSCCQLSAWDLDSAQAGVRTWCQWLGQQAKSSTGKVVWYLSSWGSRVSRLLKMLCALLFLVLLGSLGMCLRVSKALLHAGAGKLGRTSSGAWLLSLLASLSLRRMGVLFRESRTCKYVSNLLWKWRALWWAPEGLRTSRQGDAAIGSDPTGGGRYQPSQEVARLLALAAVPEEELNPFQVLGLEATASDMELKKAYRQLAVLVHPDKNKHPRAEEAFKVLRAAWDIVSNPEKRKEYEIRRTAESELTKSMSEFLTKLQDDLREALNTMTCSRCQGKHKRFEMDRELLSARYCAECDKLHPAKEGDFWAESSMLGLKITYFAVMDGKVYDITEWAGCQRVKISPDTHRVPYHLSFGSRSTSSGGRQRTPSEGGPGSAADLQDFFNRIFQGTPGQMPNGGGFNPPWTAAPSGPAPAPKTESAAPKGDSKQKRRKKVRRPFQR